jgi:feruloyl-CoA synthase
MDMSKSTATRVRPVNILPPDIAVRRGSSGITYLTAAQPLGPYPERLTERLEHWAQVAPDRVFLAERGPDGAWTRLTYAQTLSRVRRLAQSLLDRGLSQDRSVVILSGNGVEHAMLAFASMYAGVLYAPIAPAYSLQALDYATLADVFSRMQPGLVFAADGRAFERALRAVLPRDAELVVSTSAPENLTATPFSALESTLATPAVDAAHARVNGDTIAKILFTSGSTGHPKGVINTQRMLCSNQEMLRAVLRFLGDEPPVLCDWLPWNHTAGGNHNIGLVLYNGGTFYIDDGRPTPAGVDAMVRNLREVAATAHFTVPRTYEALMPYLRADRVLRETFFSKLKIFFYAAAALSQRFFDDLQELAVQTLGEELLWVTGLGATETAPFALCTGQTPAWSGFVGYPVPGMDLKIIPVGDKLEARVRGPNITPGYFKDDARTRAAFDEEGFYRMGDALRFVDPGRPERGLLFDGRLAEDFKLSNGTWVSVGPLRTRILQQAGPYVQDVVLTAPDRAFVGALVFPNVGACRTLCPDLAADAPLDVVLGDPRVRETFRGVFQRLAAASTGSSTFVARALVLHDPPSIDAREITDKGSINQKAVLANRAPLVEELYVDRPPAGVFVYERT